MLSSTWPLEITGELLHQLEYVRQFNRTASMRIALQFLYTFRADFNRFKKRRLLRPLPRRPVFKPVDITGHQIELLLLHGSPRTTHGLGHTVPGMSSTRFAGIRAALSFRIGENPQRRW